MKKKPKKNYSVSFENIKKILIREKKAVREIESLITYYRNAEEAREKTIVLSQIKELKDYIKDRNKDCLEILEVISLATPLKESEKEKKKKKKPKIKTRERSAIEKHRIFKKVLQKEKLTDLERLTLRRVKSKKRIPLSEKETKANKYVNLANTFFADSSRKLIKNDMFMFLGRDLIKTNLQLTPISYISVMLLSTVISAIVSLFIVIFFLFFSLENFPVITAATGSIFTRFVNVFWILFVIPLITFLLMYFYPSVEKKSSESKINQELPFATMHMSTISGSMIEPTKIFSIMIMTREYPNLEKEFKKLINLVNVYGYDLVTALKNAATNSPSKKLSDLFNSLGTTIISGGDLADFFSKRAQTLLYDYRLEREKYIKFSETFMDIYISIVIAAPMILMLLLLMIRLGGLGLSLSSAMITIIMVVAVSSINALFLGFLRIKQPAEY